MLSDGIGTGIECAVYVLVAGAVAQAGSLLFDRWYRRQRKPGNSEVSGLMFGATSLIYSLILAFVIIAVWSDYEELKVTIGKEADKMNNVLAHSGTLPDSLSFPIKQAMNAYCYTVITQEWNLKEAELDQFPNAVRALRIMLLHIETGGSQQSVLNTINNDLDMITDLRRERLDHVRSHVPGAVWLILGAGSGIIVFFSYFLELPFLRLKRLYLFLLSSMIGMSFFLVDALSSPFSGPAAVSKQPYESILLKMEQHLLLFPHQNKPA